MAKSKRLSPNQLAEVKSNFAGLKQIAGYSPINPDFKVGSIEPIESELDSLLIQEAQADAALRDIKDRIANKSGEFVQKMNGAVQQVIAQFGDDSAELQAVGRKRKSDRAVGRRRGKAAKP